jgi:[CysO sulfur-carrier protein]-thiocarboxylate-dependent cysteine synthase
MRFANIIDSIGHTPLVGLSTLSPHPALRLYAKLEGANPTGSVKDRIARQMILDAECEGRLAAGSVILEPTSGNTGIGLAMIARVRGYRFIAVMPDNVTRERQHVLRLFGADIIFTPGAEGSNGAVRHALRLASEHPEYVLLYQYGSPSNPRAHYETTAPEIIADLPDVDVFVAGLGTGGTLTGVGRRLKEYNPAIKVVAAEPLQGEGVQGLRSLEDGFVPPVLDSTILDARILVHAEDSIRMMRSLVDQEGIFTGPSGGAAVHAALRVARSMERGNIVVVLADGGWKYLSEDLWTRELGCLADELEDKLLW